MFQYMSKRSDVVYTVNSVLTIVLSAIHDGASIIQTLRNIDYPTPDQNRTSVSMAQTKRGSSTCSIFTVSSLIPVIFLI
jgi:hypothetical protein